MSRDRYFPGNPKVAMTKASPLFQRTTLAGQLANALRQSIRTGKFKKQLPPERMLCEMLHASRPVIRQALHILQDEGLLHIRRGHPAKVTPKAPRRAIQTEKGRVALLFSDSNVFLSWWGLMVIDEIRRELYARGFQLDLLMEPGIGRKHPQALLQKLIDQHPTNHWILAGTSLAVQEWFRKSPHNVVVMGNSFPQFHLPFVNDDLRAVTRHAANMFRGLGHRHIVFLMRNKGSAGEAEEEGGFREAFRDGDDAVGTVVKHSEHVTKIRERLMEIFSWQPRVTALLVSHAEDTLVVMNWFFEKGIHLPRDVSLISFQWESFLERLRPRPAWYYTDPKNHARKLCRLIFHSGAAKKSPRLLMPVFYRNETLAESKPTHPTRGG